MIYDERSISKLGEALKEQGWTGSAGELGVLLAEISRESSLRAFIDVSKIVHGSKAHSRILNLAAGFQLARFATTVAGVAIYMSNREKGGEAACYFDYGIEVIRLRFKGDDDDDFSTEQVTVCG